MVRFTTQFFILDKLASWPKHSLLEQGVKQRDLHDNGKNTIKAGVGRQRDKRVREAGERGTGSGRL